MTKFDHDDCIEEKDVKDCSYTSMKSIGIDEGKVSKIDALV